MLDFPAHDGFQQLFLISLLDLSHVVDQGIQNRFALNDWNQLLKSPLLLLIVDLGNQVHFSLFSDLVPFLEAGQNNGTFLQNVFFSSLQSVFLSYLFDRSETFLWCHLTSWFGFHGSDSELIVVIFICAEICYKAFNLLSFDFPRTVSE